MPRARRRSLVVDHFSCQFSGVVDNPDLDLDDIVLEMLERRHDRITKSDVERADALRRFVLPTSSPPPLLKIKQSSNNSLGQPMVFTPIQFASYFGETNVVHALLCQHPSQVEDGLMEASRQGYLAIVQMLLSTLPLLRNPHAVGRAFVLATTHCHVDVMAHMYPHVNSDLLCKGDWCSRDQLGLRYIAAAVHAAVEQNSVDALTWLLQWNHLHKFELERAFMVAMRRATSQASNEEVLRHLPLLCAFVHHQPFLASVMARDYKDSDQTNARQAKAVTSYLLADLHTNKAM
ncbi:hypothetical protein, variant 1 [Aphanomyces astaci]|uniref:Uncharacterized protein n=1 Tax=Aphanomyces astaci TaxID=112090 RepID=W4GHI5_APHAT|nr:hypothetical protein, variant 1 [Aphanomyces astaci]ETV79160.1 hypothetical protein, variant 1 [Aphanomyces astaci]RQM27745.1 hypothetical protein B5M09_002902 [Aphanomyces astaci]|eukprot:XP_009831001.1 hypothetical protein, variant 1 [Aphanomyces astaci]